jgi:hypothetical protein
MYIGRPKRRRRDQFNFLSLGMGLTAPKEDKEGTERKIKT